MQFRRKEEGGGGRYRTEFPPPLHMKSTVFTSGYISSFNFTDSNVGTSKLKI